MYKTQRLPTDGKTSVTLARIPFTAAGSGQLEITSLNDLFIGASNAGGSGGGLNAFARLTCALSLDGKALATTQRSWNNAPVDRSFDLTTTSTFSAGKHTLSFACIGWLASGYSAGGFVIQMGSEGMSATLVTN